jgi:hypothetical protein
VSTQAGQTFVFAQSITGTLAKMQLLEMLLEVLLAA